MHRSFYEDLPDLLSTVPPNLLGLTEDQAEQLREEERRKQKEERSAATAEEGEGEGEATGNPSGEDELALVDEMTGLSVVEEGDEDRGSDDEVSTEGCYFWEKGGSRVECGGFGGWQMRLYQVYVVL